MSGKFGKMRSEMSRRFDEENITLTAHRDYDFERRSTDMKRLGHALAHFDHAVTQGMVAMKEIASSFEAVGQAFTELTLGAVNTHSSAAQEPAPYPLENEDLSAYNTNSNHNISGDLEGATPEGSQQRFVDASGNFENTAHSRSRRVSSGGARVGGGAASVASTRLTDETNGQVRRLAQVFAEETRRINEGQPFQTYNAGMHRDVVTRLRPVSEHLKAVEDHRHRRTEALQKYNRYKADVEKVEKQYAKKGKPFCDSKSHKKYLEKRDEAWREYVKRREKFNETFSLLMEVNDHAAAQIIHRYLALNDEYLRQLVASIERILPAMAEAYPLNQEYTSAQNALIVEAVANARTPFAKHYRDNELEMAEPGDEEGEEGDDGEEPATVSSTEHAGAGAGAGGGGARGASASAASSQLEEPTTDDHRAGGAGHRVPLMGDAGTPAAAPQPPHEDDSDAEDGHVRSAGNTTEEPGYALTQALRLRTELAAADDSVSPAPALPGSVGK